MEIKDHAGTGTGQYPRSCGEAETERDGMSEKWKDLQMLDTLKLPLKVNNMLDIEKNSAILSGIGCGSPGKEP